MNYWAISDLNSVELHEFARWCTRSVRIMNLQSNLITSKRAWPCCEYYPEADMVKHKIPTHGSHGSGWILQVLSTTIIGPPHESHQWKLVIVQIVSMGAAKYPFLRDIALPDRVERIRPSTHAEAVKKLLTRILLKYEICRWGRGQSIGSRCDKFNAPPPTLNVRPACHSSLCLTALTLIEEKASET